ncbi:MAG: hypothetical protein COV48_10510 [Elusimicrobia bacterium CG11_big_fil_rev_8_21_14_0_20_64_6]|nr:MAG: hypothetical protein COV48_10510 [Elusimicrobia bacterium CG11_big_fil_rev_8_21_14_0_20_64_6]
MYQRVDLGDFHTIRRLTPRKSCMPFQNPAPKQYPTRMLPVLLAVLLTVSAQAVPPSFAAAQVSFLRGSANDGFHEALGDTIALSVTPEYLKTVGLIDTVPGPEGDIDLLLKMAMERVSFIPFGLLVDQWRWGVFTGKIKPENYNQAWWDLVRKYQGQKPPVARSETDFDPGAKYHIPANTPYSRYFLAHILQFQFYRSLCQQGGHKGPLHRCSFYGDKAAGKRLGDMMAMGSSRPWPEALEAATGQKQMDATAVLEYFAPLKAWLDEQNKGQTTGWN